MEGSKALSVFMLGAYMGVCAMLLYQRFDRRIKELEHHLYDVHAHPGLYAPKEAPAR